MSGLWPMETMACERRIAALGSVRMVGVARGLDTAQIQRRMDDKAQCGRRGRWIRQRASEEPDRDQTCAPKGLIRPSRQIQPKSDVDA